MRDILDRLDQMFAGGKKVALATVIATERSAPRDPGAVLAVTEDLEVAGSVSGGCVEAAVVEEAVEAIRTGRPKRLTYGISDEDARAVGLSCGGTVHVFVEVPAGAIVAALARAIRGAEPVALATQVSGPRQGAKLLVTPREVTGGLGGAGLDDEVAADARAMLEHAETGLRRYHPGTAPGGEDVEVFIESFAPPPAMYVFGATTHAAAVVRIGKFLGYRVTVCDARRALATPERLPDADVLVVRWPDEFLAEAPVNERTVICVLTHDPKFDLPLLRVALATPAAYIGALGSRRTHEARCAALVEAGVPKETLARIRAPIGLDLGARTPEEIAVAIAGEIVALRYGRSGGFPGGRSGRSAASQPVTR